MTYANKDKYQGEWISGQPNGNGGMFYHNGDVYYGEWYNGEKNGQGKLYYENKDIYTGEWINNILMNGHVYKSYKIDGDLAGNYEGGFFNGLRHGFGIMRYNNEITYVGDWYNDEKDGFGYYINISNFEIYEGSFYLGLKHGEGFEFIYNPYDNSYFHAANYIDSLTEKQKRKLIEELIDPTLVENIQYKKTNQKLYPISYFNDPGRFKKGIWKNGTYIGPGTDNLPKKKWFFF